MADWTDIPAFADGKMIGAYLLNRIVRDNENHLYRRGMPQRAKLFHDESLVVTGNALAAVVNTSYHNWHYMYQNASANGDKFTQSVVLSEGAYYFTTEHVDLSSGGIMTFTLGGNLIAVRDFYAAVTTPNRVTGPAFYIDDCKRYTLECEIVGQNGSSGGYDAPISAMIFKPVKGDT